MSGGKRAECPTCGEFQRLKPVLTRKDGFAINHVCAKCLRHISLVSYSIRDMSVAMALGMMLEKEGGVMKVGGQCFQFKPVESGGTFEFWKQIEEEGLESAPLETEEERRARRQAELDRLYPKDDNAICWSEDVVEDWRRQ